MGRKKNIDIKYRCLGSAKMVTGSCHHLQIKVNNKTTNIIVDYGMVQNNIKKINELYEINSMDKHVDWEKIDYIFVSHGHLDHIGCIPLAIMNGYKGNIISTAPTMKLSRLILTDSAFLQAKECERWNKSRQGKKSPIYPLYSMRHIEQTMEVFRGYDYNRVIELEENINITLKPAGHLLGACSILIEVRHGDEYESILFTGDISGDKSLPFTQKPNFKEKKIKNIISEGTYGDKIQSNNNVKKKLKRYIEETCIKNNGQLMIPVFSVGRSTSVLSYLYDLYNENIHYNEIPLYLASPMACKSNDIYGEEDSFNFYDKKWQKYKDMFRWKNIQYINDYKVLEKEILNSKPKIVLASAGMISGGYSVAVATSLLPNKKNTMLFCGYQGVGTQGRKILESEYGEKINIDSKDIKRLCSIDFMSMSSHGDYNKITQMFKKMQHTKIRNIILTHGDEEVLDIFKSHLDKEFNSKNIVANYNKWIKLN